MGSPDGFASLGSIAPRLQGIEAAYVDGVSITYGSPGNRHHVYTYAAGISENSTSTYPLANDSMFPCAGGTKKSESS